MRIIGIDPGSRATGYGVIDLEGTRLRWVASLPEVGASTGEQGDPALLAALVPKGPGGASSRIVIYTL